MSARGPIPASLALALTITLPLALAGLARASDDPILARLHRIARGEWVIGSRPAAGVPYAAQIRAAARKRGISASLLAALVRAESGFNPRAVSSAGAQGLGQLMPSTARALGVTDAFDPLENLDASARYVAAQLRRFGSVRLALAAYHAGPGRALGGLAAVPSSTRVYVRRVMRYERAYRERALP